MNKFDINTFVPDNHMFIEASAGTGKTYTITSIVEKLVNDYKVPLEKILIVTFTEKATGELRNRIREVLPKEDVDNASIYTIHSFCQNILKEFAYTAAQPYVLNLVDEKSAIIPFIEKWIRDDLKKQALFKKIYKILPDVGNELLRKLPSLINKYYLNSTYEEDTSVVEFVKTKISTDHFEFDYTNLDDLFAAKDIKDLEKLFPGIENHFSNLEQVGEKEGTGKNKTINGVFSYYKNLANSIKQNLNDGVVKFIDKAPSKSAANTNVANAGIEGTKALEFFGEVYKVIALVSNDLLTLYTEYLSAKLYKLWFQEKQNRKLQSYDDMIRSVREGICKKDSSLKRDVQNKYSYAIIDEFQDTNQLQWDIFSRIFIDETAPEKHFIYVVGDPKQSIYAFRNSDVNVYLKAIKEIENKNGQKKVLDTNWRSTPSMITACNKFFSNYVDENDTKGGFFLNNDGFEFSDSQVPENKNKNALFENKETEPFWICEQTDNYKFADVVAQKIMECCSVDKNNKTKLQLWDKNTESYRNVSFSDFAILGKTRYEFLYLEEALRTRGVPFLRYKDTGLFTGMECSNWISLLNAITAKDFTYTNRRILSEVLFSKFFNIELSEVQGKKYDSPLCYERQLIYKWHCLAENREWTKLIEAIFRDTNLEKNLSSLDQIQSLSKFRQIGNYIVDYLYKNNCSIEDLVKELNDVSAGGEDDDNYVSRGTDFNCVQFMTIHGSKGLEFPVVISLAGLSGVSSRDTVYFYHKSDGENTKAYLSLSKPDSLDPEKLDNYTLENYQELERLIYVAMTRAKAVMMLPVYSKWVEKEMEGETKLPEFQFIKSAYKRFMTDENKALFKKINLETKSISSIQEILKANNTEEIKNESVTKEEQEKVNKALADRIYSLSSMKYSYSTLSHGKKKDNKELSEDGSISYEEEADSFTNISLSDYDPQEFTVAANCKYDETKIPKIISEKYPAGAKLGSAVHRVFELVDFEQVCSKDYKNELKYLINLSFAEQGYILDEEDSKLIRAQTESFVENTVNGILPEIVGNHETGNSFRLCEIPMENHRAEMEFNFISDSKDYNKIKAYCNGFIDLVFMREIDGQKVYSILDWKSDSSKEENLSSSKTDIKEHTDEHYSIQRVLYSYCLVNWLKQFPEYAEKELETIFNENFGGVYYVYIRSCAAETGNGFYAHTWKSWEDLKRAYENIRNKLMR